MELIKSIANGNNTVQLYRTVGFSVSFYTVRYLIGSDSIFTGKYAEYEDAEKVFDNVYKNKGILYV
jgi:hypothetical protein